MTMEYWSPVPADAAAGQMFAIPYQDPEDTPNRHYIFEPGPLWLPPALAAKCTRTKTWEIEITYASPYPEDEQLSLLDGTYSLTVAAGTIKREGTPDNESVEIANDPGWETLREAVERKRRKHPDPPEYHPEWLHGYHEMPIGYALGHKSIEVISGAFGQLRSRIAVTVAIGDWAPIWRATREADEMSPPKWYDHDGLEAGWSWDLTCVAAVSTSNVTLPGQGVETFLTRIAHYEERKIGSPHDDEMIDDAMLVKISHGSFFDSIDGD